MTKKHFIALADVLRGTKPPKPVLDIEATRRLFKGRVFQWENEVLAFAEYLSTFPNFNRELWLDYVNGKCSSSGGKL